MSTPRRSARNSAYATCSKARCSATRTGCASTPSSSTRNPARISGPIVSRRTSPTCSVQDQIVARLGNTLGYELIKAEAQRDSRIGNLEAFDLAMRGRALLLRYQQQRTKE